MSKSESTLKTTRQAAQHKAAVPPKIPAKAAKPTKWGKDLLTKMDAFRKALAAQQ